jgi:hypothetical protein
MTVAATHVDGLVLSLTPNSHSYNYRSAVLFGYAVPVTSPEERLWAMQLITDGVVPGRWAATRVPPTPGELASTSLLRIRITAGSAKIRSGMPNDDKADREDGDLLAKTWTGVVPVYQTYGEPLSGPYNQLATLPGYLADYIKDSNDTNKDMAAEAAVTPMTPKKATKGDDE